MTDLDFAAESITALGEQCPTTSSGGFRSFDVMNPHDDGISLDVFVDWLIDAGHHVNIRRCRYWTPTGNQSSRCSAHRHPPKCSATPYAPRKSMQTKIFRTFQLLLIDKYVADLKHLGLLANHEGKSA